MPDADADAGAVSDADSDADADSDEEDDEDEDILADPLQSLRCPLVEATGESVCDVCCKTDTQL